MSVRGRPLILLDVDGPLTVGFMEAACAHLRDLGVTDATASRISDWDLAKAFGASAEIEAEMYARLRREGVAASFAPRPGARDFVERLRKWSRVVAVTAPLKGSRTWVYERSAWLREHLDFAAYDVVNADDKSLVCGDALVEDRVSNLVSWCDAWPFKLGVVWDEAYNRPDPRADSRLMRVRSFDELQNLLERWFLP